MSEELHEGDKVGWNWGSGECGSASVADVILPTG
jgi:hypothetical protein